MPKEKTKLTQSGANPGFEKQRSIYNVKPPDPPSQTDARPPISSLRVILKREQHPHHRRARFKALPYRDTRINEPVAGPSKKETEPWPKREIGAVPASTAEPDSTTPQLPRQPTPQLKVKCIVEQMRMVSHATKYLRLMLAGLQLPIEEARKMLWGQVASAMHAPSCESRNMVPAQLLTELPTQLSVRERYNLILRELYPLLDVPASQCWNTGTNCPPFGCAIPSINENGMKRA